MKQLYLSLTLLLLFTSCSVRVRTAYDHRVDFSRYKSFCWLKGCEFTFTGPKYFNDTLVQRNMQRAIVTEMSKKGFNYDSNMPDLLMDVHVLIENDTAYTYHVAGDNFIMNFTPEEIVMLKGTLVIDLVDKSTSQMVWRSTAVSYFDTHPELTEKNIRTGVAAAIRKFPPKQKITQK